MSCCCHNLTPDCMSKLDSVRTSTCEYRQTKELGREDFKHEN